MHALSEPSTSQVMRGVKEQGARGANRVGYCEGGPGGVCVKVFAYETVGDIHTGSVLPDEMHVLQFSYGSGVCGEVCALCGGGVPGDSWTPGIVSSGGCGIARAS